MHKNIYIFCLLIIIFYSANFATADGPPSIELLTEGFEYEMPPNGWSLERSNTTQTWQSVTNAFDYNLNPASGTHFAFVQGDNLNPSDEMLITPMIKLPGHCISSGFYNLIFDFWYNAQNLSLLDYLLSIELSNNQYPNWSISYNIQIDHSSDSINVWDEFFEETDNISSQPSNTFWIGFRFIGSDLSTEAAFALDALTILCEDFGDDDTGDDDSSNDDTIDNDDTNNDDFSDDDDNFDDDMTDDDQSNDDTSGSDTSDDDDSGKACGC